MKPIAISSCLVLAALSLYAADPQQAPKAGAATLHPERLLSAPRAVGIGDSPLVRAAKATNRLGKKPSMVITNETLIREGGHFTTTTAEAQAQLPATQAPASSWDQIAADTKRNRTEAAAAAEHKKKLEELKKQAAARAAARAEGDSPEALYDDPPALEGPIQTIKPMTPQTMGQPQKPPQ